MLNLNSAVRFSYLFSPQTSKRISHVTISKNPNRLSTLTDVPLHWRHNGRDGVSNHHCLLNGLFRRRSKQISKLRVAGLCAWNSSVTGEFPAQMTSNAKIFPFDDVILVAFFSSGLFLLLAFTQLLMAFDGHVPTTNGGTPLLGRSKGCCINIMIKFVC